MSLTARHCTTACARYARIQPNTASSASAASASTSIRPTSRRREFSSTTAVTTRTAAPSQQMHQQQQQQLYGYENNYNNNSDNNERMAAYFVNSIKALMITSTVAYCAATCRSAETTTTRNSASATNSDNNNDHRTNNVDVFPSSSDSSSSSSSTANDATTSSVSSAAVGLIACSSAAQDFDVGSSSASSSTSHLYEPVNQEELLERQQEKELAEVELSSIQAGRKPYDISVRALQGSRLTMEDEYCVAAGGRFVAVFDGHGGNGVARYLRSHLYSSLQKHVQIKHWEETDLLHANHQALPSMETEETKKQQQEQQPTLDGLHTSNEKLGTSCSIGHDETNIGGGSKKQSIPSVACYAAALRSAFMEIENDVLEDDNYLWQGSTAVAVVVHENEDGHRTLLSANVGDSRAILSRGGKAVALTRDHKPNDDLEKARILAMGETIVWDRLARVYRVKSLSLSRAIGDQFAKPAVSGEVDINHYPIHPQDVGDDEFVLLASDGLWDVMSSEDAVQFVHEFMDKEIEKEKRYRHSPEEMHNYKHVLRKSMAKFVAREAIRRGTADNISVVIVWLNDLKRDS